MEMATVKFEIKTRANLGLPSDVRIMVFGV